FQHLSTGEIYSTNTSSALDYRHNNVSIKKYDTLRIVKIDSKNYVKSDSNCIEYRVFLWVLRHFLLQLMYIAVVNHRIKKLSLDFFHSKPVWIVIMVRAACIL